MSEISDVEATEEQPEKDPVEEMDNPRSLYLMRHADSETVEDIDQDIHRSLTEEGKINASEMGKRLKERGVKPNLIYTSPAKRAKQTAEIIAKELGYAKSRIREHTLIYEATSRILLEVINSVEEEPENFMVIGHNPAVSRIVKHLTNEESIENIPPTGVVSITFDITRWSHVSMGNGHYDWYDSPQNAIQSNLK